MLEVVNGFIELAGIELAAVPFRLEFLETPGDFVEVVDLMAVEAGAARRLVEVGHDALDEELLVTTVAVPVTVTLLRVAPAITRVVPIIWVLLPALRARANGQDSAAEQDQTA